ncbi:MFS transporter, partial [Pontibacterium sp.]
MPEHYAQKPSARWLALVSICIATFLIPQSMSAVNMALPAIAEDLQADAVLVSWLPTANIWGSIILMLPAGRIADMIGRKQVYLAGVLFFSLSSLMALVVESIEWLLIARVLQ